MIWYKLKLTCTHFVPRPLLSLTLRKGKENWGKVEEEPRKGRRRVEENKYTIKEFKKGSNNNFLNIKVNGFLKYLSSLNNKVRVT
ncbi:hypothetical protein BpHYR1_049726 [Brachionus plicatilis]|uniref:Uncharacterized protein n=1 Tax=Brachionus plicatilis TaxID=10195 RepID=A0A3M7QIX0_BRAPC|nr:hypothetical protein BpHYR1_049726 [Brachionus plicatilis]